MAGNKKNGRQAAAAGDIPHSYLLGMVAKGQWAVKEFLRL
jgi:hypothetical protein